MRGEIEVIVYAVLDAYKLKFSHIVSPSRVRPLPEARMMLIRILREYLGTIQMPYTRIGYMINRWPSNICRHDKLIQEWIRIYPDIKAKYESITETLKEKGYEKKAENTPTGSAAPADELYAEK